jgi:hypothetical protein
VKPFHILSRNLHYANSFGTMDPPSPPIEMKESERCELAVICIAMIRDLRVVVRDPNADITLLSSDNVLFRFHKKQLETHSGVFAASAASVKDDPFVLTEPSVVVDLFLRLMSLQDPPDLDFLEFQTLALLAEAVEKYDVFHSKTICRMFMQYVHYHFCESRTPKDYRNHIPQHSVEVLEYAVKHGYAELADKAAPNAIGCKATDIANKFSLETLKAWVCLFLAVLCSDSDCNGT